MLTRLMASTRLWLSGVFAWHSQRRRAQVRGMRGWVWLPLVAAVFFWMSNPLVFVPGFHLAIERAVFWTVLVLVLTLPWIRIPWVPWPWLAVHAVCLASISWTIDPHLTDYTNLLYAKISFVALMVAANCDPDVVSWGMGLGGVVVVFLSVYAYQQEMWGSGFYNGVGRLTGVGTNPNIFAYTVAISLSALLALGPPRRLVVRLLWMSLLATNLAGVWLAGSGTGYLAVICTSVAAVLFIFLPSVRDIRPLIIGGLVATTILAASLLFIVNVFGKDLWTLSSRAPFWVATIQTSQDRLWLGNGWGAVWQHPWSMVPMNPVLADIWERAGYALPHGHNLFIDVLPELGLAGVALALIMVLYAVREVVRNGVLADSPNPVAGRQIALCLVALLISGITEPMLTVPLGWWALLVVVAGARQRVLPPAQVRHKESGWLKARLSALRSES